MGEMEEPLLGFSAAQRQMDRPRGGGQRHSECTWKCRWAPGRLLLPASASEHGTDEELSFFCLYGCLDACGLTCDVNMK
ncbi:hypothetical protein L249_0826 [Ophiocordyceps polyrhachis-furcata BCC 54312]|uniref:Uncharacterized protein n=1 Tax=Ophiocordyceps polyrhachis-furcata BCC 54312 TaxID=1330021 RepID=A0A367LFP1_9HYPO|nr:hypothetical protein L249_0826 [Ophiocordyceps polyrhachis-furcata BCC 54312]